LIACIQFDEPHYQVTGSSIDQKIILKVKINLSLIKLVTVLRTQLDLSKLLDHYVALVVLVARVKL
jgi:hypothetical protein